jgi:hypothetical protein
LRRGRDVVKSKTSSHAPVGRLPLHEFEPSSDGAQRRGYNLQFVRGNIDKPASNQITSRLDEN